MRSIRWRLLATASVGALMAALVLMVSAPTAQAKNWDHLTKMQKRLASGAMSTALAPATAGCVNPTGGGDEGDEADNECAPDSYSSPSSTTAANAGGYAPTGNGACAETLGNGVKVNQNCENVSDAALAGRGQAQNETSIAIDPKNPKNIWPARTTTAEVTATATARTAATVAGPGTTPRSRCRSRPARSSAPPASTGRPAATPRWPTTPRATPTSAARSSTVAAVPRRTPTSPVRSTSSARPATTAHRGTSPAVRWQRTTTSPAPGTLLEDKQLMTVDNHVGSPLPGPRLRHLDRVRRRRFELHLRVFLDDYGETFSPRHLVSTTSPLCTQTFGFGTPQGPCNENQFSQPFTGTDGALYVTFANFNNTPTGADNRNQMLLAKSTDGGMTFSAPVKVSDYYDLPDCATYQHSDPGRACVPEKGDSQRSVFRATNYPSGAVDPTNPGRVVVTFGSYINKDSKEANGCVPTGFSQYGINTYTGVKVPGACNNDILLSTSSDGGKTFTGTTQDPRRADRQPRCPAGDDRPVLAMGGVQRPGPVRRQLLRPAVRQRRDRR